jgi:hypothetical protein
MSGEKACATRLLQALVKDDCLTVTSCGMIERYMKTWDVSAFHALLESALMSEAELANALARTLAIPRLYHLPSLKLAEEATAAVTFRRAREWECLPLRGEGGGVELVLADPTRDDRIGEIKRGLTVEITLAVAERSDILKAVDELYPLALQLPSLYSRKMT